MASDINNKNFVQDYKDSLKQKAEHLIIKGFPEKICKLNELLEAPYFKDLCNEHQVLDIPGSPSSSGEPNAKRRLDTSEVSSNSIIKGPRLHAFYNGSVPCNKPLIDIISLVKPHIRELVEDFNLVYLLYVHLLPTVFNNILLVDYNKSQILIGKRSYYLFKEKEIKMWISFMIPKIEDGNNFGVSIQEVTLAEVQSVQSEAAAFFDQISNYFISRAKIISKIAKYPHIEDYRRAVKELDEKEHLSLWFGMCEIRNRYCSLHDIVLKNLEKIKKPRSSNAESLY